MGSSLSYPEVDINSNRTFLVTGGNSGIGYETAKNIARLGGHVIIACRNMTKADAAIKQMQVDYEADLKKKTQASTHEPKKLNIEAMEVDLSSFSSTMRFIEAFKARNCNLNVLVCNAGVAGDKKEITEDGFELMLQANYLGHFIIILHLLPILASSGSDSRVVQVSSDAYSFGKVDIKNMNGEVSYGAMKFYGNSKLYQIMSMYWLCRHLKDKSVTVTSLHPGLVSTQMTRSNKWTGNCFAQAFTMKEADGAANSIKAAIDPSLNGTTSVFFKDCSTTTTQSFTRHIEKQDALMKYTFDSVNTYLPSNINDLIDN